MIATDLCFLYLRNGVLVKLNDLELRVVGPTQISGNADAMGTRGSVCTQLGWFASGPEQCANADSTDVVQTELS